MAKVIGEIANNAVNIATYEEREKINKLSLEKFKVSEKLGDKRNTDEGKQILAGYDAQINRIQENIDRTYGIGSPNGMAIRAVTAALQAAAQNDTNGAIVALASPYLNKQIHEMTNGDSTKDKAANLAAHALLSAVEFQLTGKDPLTGAVAGVTGEITAEIIAKKLYEKSPKELTASEKENISTLSQIAGGLAGALTSEANNTAEQQGGNFLTATAGAETAKRAVENNFLSDSSRKRLNYLLQKRQRGEELTKDEKEEIVGLGYFDQRSDWLLDKIKRGEKLSKVEKIDFDRFLERYLLETASGRTNYGGGERNVDMPRTTIDSAMKVFKRDHLDRDAARNYSFPVYGYQEQVDDAMKHVPEEHQTLLGWGRSKDDWKPDEVIYREVQNELELVPRLPQNFAELSEEIMNSIVAIGGGRAANAKRIPTRYGVKATPTMAYNDYGGPRYRQVEYLVSGKGANANDKLPLVDKFSEYEKGDINVLGYTKPIGSRYNQMNQPKNPNYQPVRNESAYISGREYSGHALDRMQDRGIFPSVIENTIKVGNKITNELGVSIYKDRINGIKVITNDKGKVITVTYEK
ncbi:VENN motif pre-toxin domain-containing protein [Rodentibacter trehalosifermentans]|uniref:VENN motif pre-toxin domain-containing protein n=1 Tax=Rodentibacter trehalosifermentans TaxID=1908263 RepID=UPI000986EFC3|nr:VENN motif pre-toxin domain-containing protein [Rodentibacter trehalosifermentans]OOF52595.1 hypothetical protein BKK53_04585 [Rodentibacter trehalosifermentans]